MATLKSKPWIRNVSIWISENGMEAFARVTRGEGLILPNIKELLDHLKSSSIIVGLQKESLMLICDANNTAVGSKEYLIAKGETPEDPTEGKIIYHIDVEQKGKPIIRDDGSVDHKEFDLLTEVKKGDILAEKIQPKFGKPGKTVRGEPVPIEEVEILNLPAGKNTEIDPNNRDILIASINGTILLSGRTIHVLLEKVIDKDIDSSTGNIHSAYSVRIKGNITSGYLIHSKGDITVEGTVEDAEIFCQGNLMVKGGIITSGNNTIFVKGNLEARFIHGARVRVLGNIVSHDEISNCKIECGGELAITRNGVLLGGDTYIYKKLTAKIIGSENATYTNVFLGYDQILREENKKIKEDLNSLSVDSIKLSSSLYYKALQDLLDGKNKALIPQKLEADKLELTEKYDRLECCEGDLKYIEDILFVENMPSLKAFSSIFPGVKIASKTTAYHVKNQLVGPHFFIIKDGRIIKA